MERPIQTTQQHLQLLMEHPSFAWLRPLSGLIVRIDERLAKLGMGLLLGVDARIRFPQLPGETWAGSPGSL